jgi:hypothetical protein
MPLAEQREQLREGELQVGVGSYAHARVIAGRVYNSWYDTHNVLGFVKAMSTRSKARRTLRLTDGGGLCIEKD